MKLFNYIHIKQNVCCQIKEDTELAKNALPGGEGPNNPLESTDDGNIRCKVVIF